ncbi:MAG: hypothetical protein HQ509_03550 [Candidatus Marinimicrobia bacterium]|nr:hypothetical protein [Candidatus Neomarinimicrobiota bacterium]
MNKYIFIIFGLISTISAQFSFSGEISPSAMIRQSNTDIIDLPYRLLWSELSYGMGDFELKSTLAVDHRLESGEFEGDLRELYAIWYPSFGEVKFGKQIHVWGAADGNNPTDNLNPYDYYFMFLPGAERKLGVLSASANIYLGKWQAELVLIPYHTGNRIPYDEPDFPIIPMSEPDEEFIEDIENDMEFGLRLKTMIGENDVSVSYFSGNDRGLSPSTMGLVHGEAVPTMFGYRNTQMLGLDIVGFLNEITYRAETAYFSTKDEGWRIDSKATYSQYVLQFEYTGWLDIQFSCQYIGSKTHSFLGKTTVVPMDVIIDLDESIFQPGMGTPFAMFTDKGFMGGAKATLWDNTLDLSGNIFYDLDEKGKMVGFEVEYSPVENWIISLGSSSFYGDKDKPQYPFTKLEDFSHYRVGIKYSF